MDLLSEDKAQERDAQYTPFSCQYCKETFSGPIPLHQHERYLCKMNEEIKAVLKPNDTVPTGRRGLFGSEQQAGLIPSSLERNSTRNATSIRQTNGKPLDSVDYLRGETPSPLNLSSSSSKHSHSSSYTPNSLASEDAHGEPLDLSLPKQVFKARTKAKTEWLFCWPHYQLLCTWTRNRAFNLAHIKKEFNGPNSLGNEISWRKARALSLA